MPGQITQDTIDADAVALVLEAKRHFKELRENAKYDQEWKDFKNSYFNGSADFYNGASRVRIPALHQAVERIVPKMDKVIFPPDGNFFEARAKDPYNDVEVQNAEIVTALIKEQFMNINARSKMIGVYRSLATYGTVFGKVYWQNKVKERYKRVNGKREKVYETVFDDPDFYSPSIWDIYVDPKDENLEGALVEEIITDYQDLWRLRVRNEDGEEKGVYKNVEKVKGSWVTKEKDSEKERVAEIDGLSNHKYGSHEQKVSVLEYWGAVPKYFFTGSFEDKENYEVVENALIVIADTCNGGVALRISDNPFDHQEKPYLRARYIKVDGRLYGIGVMSVNIPLEMELNTLRNQLMDGRTFMLKNKWLLDRNAEISEIQLTDLFNQIIETNNVNGLVALRPPDFSASAINNEAIIKQDIEDSTGASKLLSGTPSGSSLDRTAEGVATVVSAGLERFELVVTTFQEEWIKPKIKMFWQLDQQFLPEGRDVQLIGKVLPRVIPSEIPNNFEINFTGTKELGEKGFKLNLLNILLQNISPFIPMGLDPLPIIRKFFQLASMPDLARDVFAATEKDQLENTPEGELQLLQSGRSVKINLNDDHDSYIAAYQQLLNSGDLPDNVRQNTLEALGQRLLAKQMIAITIQKGQQPNA